MCTSPAKIVLLKPRSVLMPFFRKRPVVVEAIQWTGDNERELAGWTTGGFYSPYLGNNTGRLYVKANTAWLTISKDEWVLKDSAGFHPCKAEIFAETYAPVTPAPGPSVEQPTDEPQNGAETFAADVAKHGLRCDMNPTMDFSSAGAIYTQFSAYLRRVDEMMRERARAALAAAPPVPLWEDDAAVEAACRAVWGRFDSWQTTNPERDGYRNIMRAALRAAADTAAGRPTQ